MFSSLTYLQQERPTGSQACLPRPSTSYANGQPAVRMLRVRKVQHTGAHIIAPVPTAASTTGLKGTIAPALVTRMQRQGSFGQRCNNLLQQSFASCQNEMHSLDGVRRNRPVPRSLEPFSETRLRELIPSPTAENVPRRLFSPTSGEAAQDSYHVHDHFTSRHARGGSSGFATQFRPGPQSSAYSPQRRPCSLIPIIRSQPQFLPALPPVLLATTTIECRDQKHSTRLRVRSASSLPTPGTYMTSESQNMCATQLLAPQGLSRRRSRSAASVMSSASGPAEPPEASKGLPSNSEQGAEHEYDPADARPRRRVSFPDEIAQPY